MASPAAHPLELPAGPQYGARTRKRPAVADWTRVRRRLERADYWWLTTSRDSGSPHVSAVLGVWWEDALYWSMSPRTLTARNVKRRPAMAAHLPNARSVVIVDGRARMLRSGGAPRQVAAAYRRRYGLRFDPSDRAMRRYVLRPRTARSWLSDEMRATAVRWVFDEKTRR